MIHKGDTQPDEIKMAQGVKLRGKTYKFRKRIPTDLWNHPKYASLKTKEINKSLGTSDLREANRKAANIEAELENQFAACRREAKMNLQHASVSEASSAPVIPTLRNSKISIREIDAIWVTEHDRLEREAVSIRDEWSNYDQESRDIALSDLYTEYTLINPQGEDVPQTINWAQRAEYHLELNSVARREVTDEDFIA